MEEQSYFDESAHFWSVGDRKRVFNTVMLIVMVWVLVCKNMYRYERCLTHFESFYRNPISRDGFGCWVIWDAITRGQKRQAAGHKLQHVINRRLRVLPTCPEWLRLSPGLPSPAEAGSLTAHAGLAIWQPPCFDHSRHRGESATKIVKFFVAHTVNCVICNNHTGIDWMLLNFTPAIQQNCHQSGRKFEKPFCAVNRLSCQLELSKSETRQFGSDLVFDIVNYGHLIFLHGG